MSASSPEAISAAFVEAINTRDVEGALDLWILDAAILTPNGDAVRGREAIAAALRALIDSGASVQAEVSKLFRAGGVALATGTLTISGFDAEGNPYRQQSQSVVVYERGNDGGWRVALDAPWGLPDP